MSEETKIELSLNEKRMADMQALKNDLGLKNGKDVLNHSLTLLEWAVKELKEGRTVASISPDLESYRELKFPAFDFIKKTNSEP